VNPTHCVGERADASMTISILAPAHRRRTEGCAQEMTSPGSSVMSWEIRLTSRCGVKNMSLTE